jgi:hypothetical protein
MTVPRCKVHDVKLICPACVGAVGATADAARRVFEERATHAFPPGFVMPPEWRPELEALAAELDFPLTAASAIEQRFLEVIEMLAQSAKADA